MMRTRTALQRATGAAIAAVSVWLAVTIAVAGCAPTRAATSDQTGTGAAASTATSTPLPTLAWHPVTTPPGVVLAGSSSGATMSVSPIDGHDAWLCAPSNTGDTYTIWASVDAGNTWRQVGTLVSAAPDGSSCGLQPDQLDPHTLAANFMWGCGECGTISGMSYLSEDGGATWHRVPGNMSVRGLATRVGLTYSLLSDATNNSGGYPPAVAISADGLRTWRESTPAGLEAHDGFFQLWVNPTSNEILAASLENMLWRSPDGGATWARVNTPATQISLGRWIATAPAHWLLCSAEIATPPQLACSADLGATWTPYPTLSDTYHCASCGKWGAPSGGTDSCAASVITASGALLAECTPDGTVPTPASLMLYRLAPDATTWTALGAVPGPLIYTVPATGPVWCSDSEQHTLVTATLPNE